MHLLGFILLAQANFMPPPTPPPPAPPGSEAFKMEQTQYETVLRSSCLSEGGIRLAVQHWTNARIRFLSRPVSIYQLEQDVATAAYADPVDVAALERGMRAKENSRIHEDATALDEDVRLLRALSSKDRAIFARRFTWMQPVQPRTGCKP